MHITFLTRVLFSAVSGWWKIADFGLTSEATSRRLNSTSGARGKPCYRAPELLREENPGFNKKVDIWSLGCIVYELCFERKAFKDDFETYQFALAPKPLVVEFPAWFNDGVKTTLQSLINKSLDPDHETRASTSRMCSEAGKLISHLTNQDRLELDHEQFFINTRNILSTDVPTQEGYHFLRWEIGYPRRDATTRSPFVARCKKIVQARKNLLGANHGNTFWSELCLGWALYSSGALEEAIEVFTEAIGIASNSAQPVLGEHHIDFARFGLAWTLTRTPLPENNRRGKNIFDTIITSREGSNPEGSVDRLSIAVKAATISQNILWGTAVEGDLEALLKLQRIVFEEGHADLLETGTLVAISKLFSSTRASTVEAREQLTAIAAHPARLFRIEHPGLLTLCDLAWDYAGRSYRREAIRIFKEAKYMQQKLLRVEYPSTVTSLEALADILEEGPITWSTPEEGPSRGNNRNGSKGVVKCRRCRERHKKVLEVLF
jgi:Protein kinase domain